MAMAFSILRNAYIALQHEMNELTGKYEQLEKGNLQLEEELEKQKIKEVNKNTNKPSSKQAEWEDKGVGNDGHGKPKKRGKSPRKGAGNKKKTKAITKTVKAIVDSCAHCDNDLKNKDASNSSNFRTIEDIPDMTHQLEVIEIENEKKYCNECQKTTTAKSVLAIPGADIGIYSTQLICYLWVAMSLPFTKISDYLKAFFGLDISTSGLSQHVIRVAKIMNDVHLDLVQQVNIGVTLYADETGWRVSGEPWWLWVFCTEDTAYYTVDRSRGSDVVRRVLGEIFLGLLVVDGWYAYLSLVCEQQSCMAHLFRKVRKFRDAFPHLVDIGKFYLKLRRIILDGEKLQKERDDLSEFVFYRRLNKLEIRLEKLVNWVDPDPILETIIKKVKRQQPRMLTFVKHKGASSHNNFAERMIRLGVLKKKVSGGSKSQEGAEAYAVLLSIYTTCKLRKISFPKFLKESLQQYIRTGKPMLLGAAENHSVSEKAA